MAISLNIADMKTAGGGNNANDPLVVTAPDNISAGDLILILVAFESANTGDTINSMPTGFTEFAEVSNGSDWTANNYIFYKEAVSADETATDYTFGKSDDRRFSWASMRITGHDSTTPLANLSSNTNISGVTNLSIPGITATSGNVLMSMIGIGEFVTSSNVSSITQPTGMTEQVEILQSATSGVAMGVATEDSPSGATGSRDWSWDVSTNAVGSLFEIQAAAGGDSIIIDNGSFSLAGYNVFFDLSTPLDFGTLTIAGYDLFSNLSVPLDTDNFTLSGYPTAFNLSVPLANESITLTGFDVVFNKSVPLDTGSLALDGKNLALNLSVPLDTDSFTLNGYDLEFVSQNAIALATGNFTLDGKDLSFSLVLPIGQESFSVDGKDLNFTTIASLENTSFNLDGQLLSFNQLVSLSKGTFDLQGYDLLFDAIENIVLLTGDSTIQDIQASSTIEDIDGLSTINDITGNSEL